MTADYELPEDGDDAHFSETVHPNQRPPEMRGEFVQTLSAQLEAAFAARRPAPMAPLIGPSTNGHAAQTQPGKGRGQLASAVGAVAGTASPPARARNWRRWLAGSATAAALVLVIAVSSNPPAWAAITRVLLHSIAVLTIGGGNRGGHPQADEGVPSIELPNPVPSLDTAPATVSIREEPNPIALPAAEPRVDAPKGKPTSSDVDPPPVNDDHWRPFAEPLADNELGQRVDDQLRALWRAQGIQPAEPASDAEFMRRVFLDLTGRIPSVSEAQEFLEDSSTNRRELLVDRLLTQRDHATHLAAIWRGILLPDEADLSRFGGPAKFEEWLAERFAANVPYDQIVRELLLAEGRISDSGPLLFYAAVKLNPEELAARTSRAFLGVRMECAQCHDHPFDSVTQRDFWSFAAFFARISRPQGKMDATSPVLRVQDNKRGEVSIPNSDEVLAPRLPLTASDLNDAPGAPPRRQQLVDWLTSPHNAQFSRATVNRVWAHLFGRGLVEPIDDMRPANAAVCPDVLDTLSRDFAASGFDLRRLLRALVLTNAYQLSSGSEIDDPSRVCFGQMNIKSITAEQLYDCISVATQPQALPEGPIELTGLSRFTDAGRRAFIEQFRAPGGQLTDYHAGIPQALTLMHGGLTHSATDIQSSGILKALSAPFFSDEQRLEVMFLSTLSRYPGSAELELMLPLLDAGTEADRQQARGDILWALLNSAEFTFNH